MYYVIAPKIKLIFAWSPKCACTTSKTALLMALGHEITGNVHNDMLTAEHLKSGKYGLYSLRNYRKNYDFDTRDFIKVCIIRNPYDRFVSAIRQRSMMLCRDERFTTMTAKDYLYYLHGNNFGSDHHFHPQTKNLRSFQFDRVLDVSEMSVFFELLGMHYNGERYGSHSTKYGAVDFAMHHETLARVAEMTIFPRNVSAWLDAEGLKLFHELYAGDFAFGLRNGHDYSLNKSH